MTERSDLRPAATAVVARPAGTWRPILAEMRPRQWAKNLLVVAAPAVLAVWRDQFAAAESLSSTSFSAPEGDVSVWSSQFTSQLSFPPSVLRTLSSAPSGTGKLRPRPKTAWRCISAKLARA